MIEIKNVTGHMSFFIHYQKCYGDMRVKIITTMQNYDPYDACVCVYMCVIVRALMTYFVGAEPHGRVASDAPLDSRVRHG